MVGSIHKLVSLPHEAEDAITSIAKVVAVAKKAELHPIGEVHDAVTYVYSGLLRTYEVVNGADVSQQFFFPTRWLADYHSFLTQTQGLIMVQALEASLVVQLRRKDIYELYDRYPLFERFGRIMAETAYLGQQQHIRMLATQSPQERYRTLLKERPKVLEQVPQHLIAGFLGITPESLSRLRRRLMEG